MPEFKNLTELNKYLNQQMRDVMNNEMAQMVKTKESESVEKNVYQAYTPNNGEPFVYQRRRENGGLADTKNMMHQVKNVANGVELSVENRTKGKDDKFQLDTLIEYGDGTDGKEYEYKSNRDGTADQYLRARPFTERTEEAIAQSNEHVQIMRNGLKTRGIGVT
jgi:hypothetical protein